VNIIWPQVKDQLPTATPFNQPPYKGGVLDDTHIPRTTLPGWTDTNQPGKSDAPNEQNKPVPPDEDDATS
jgi:hypothetical protein